MNVRHVRVATQIDAALEAIVPGPDHPVIDHVVRGRVSDGRSDQGTWNYAHCGHVECVNPTGTIWVVIGDFVLVGAIANPPVRGTLSVGPAGVYLATECAECVSKTGPVGPADQE